MILFLLSVLFMTTLGLTVGMAVMEKKVDVIILSLINGVLLWLLIRNIILLIKG